MFKATMLSNLSSLLPKLTVREDNDLAIAMIDAWATIADILTFYQERIANEGFLRTAAEKMSVLELARSIGYELGPGAASDTFLAFNVEENNPSIEKSIIQMGTKVQSIPQQGETSQTFETIETIEARPELNEIKANTKLPHTVDESTETLYFDGVDTRLRQDDGILIINNNDEQTKLFAKVLDVKPDEENNTTVARILIIWPTRSETSINTVHTHGGATLSTDSNLQVSDNKSQISHSGKFLPTRQEDKVTNGSSQTRSDEMNLSQLASMVAKTGISEKELIEEHNKAVVEESKSLAPQVYAFRQKAAIFGHDAPSYNAISFPNDKFCNWDFNELYIFQKVNIKEQDSGPDKCYNPYLGSSVDRPVIFLDSVYDNIITTNQDKENKLDNWVVFSRFNFISNGNASVSVLASRIESTMEETLVEYAITGKVTGIRLKELSTRAQTELIQFRRRNTTVYIQSEKLELGRKFNKTPVEGNFIELEKAVPGLKNGQGVIITGEILDEKGKPTGTDITELRRLRDVDVTTNIIFFDDDLDYKYLRESVRINANVARATHGETRSEVLGSGDPTQSQQSFTLKQKPLTFIKASTPTGISSTLEVRVDDILWRQVDYLYEMAPKDPVFITRNQNDGSTVIMFGDGKRGSRPTIGTENITAKYRTGIGRVGLLKQNQLSLLIDRPLGVKSVTNPSPTTPAEDSENLDSARTNAPLKVLTIDRIVSVSDFENFARCFAGIGKARASEIWDGSNNIVHLSIASSSGKSLDPQGFENITRSIVRFKDPQITFMLDSFNPKTFSLTAKIKISDDMLPDKVLQSVRNLILDTFSFEKRQFGQPVTLGEVVTLIQNIKGVTFVDMDELHIDDDNEEVMGKSGGITRLSRPKIQQSKLEKYLACSSAYYDNIEKKIFPAEILIINPQGVKLLVVEI